MLGWGSLVGFSRVEPTGASWMLLRKTQAVKAQVWAGVMEVGPGLWSQASHLPLPPPTFCQMPHWHRWGATGLMLQAPLHSPHTAPSSS